MDKISVDILRRQARHIIKSYIKENINKNEYVSIDDIFEKFKKTVTKEYITEICIELENKKEIPENFIVVT